MAYVEASQKKIVGEEFGEHSIGRENAESGGWGLSGGRKFVAGLSRINERIGMGWIGVW
jgi:hypothetical protein